MQLSGCQNRYIFTRLFTRWIILSLVAALTLGLAAKTLWHPLRPGLSSLTQRVKPRPRAILKNAAKTCQTTSLKRSGVPDFALCRQTTEGGSTPIGAVPVETQSSRCYRTLPNPSDRAPPILA